MSDRHKTGPRQLRSCVVILSEAETSRVNRFIVSVGTLGGARRRLGVGEDSLDAARYFGRMESKTRERLLAALDREEAVAS